jgi:hypothetical protein
MSCNLSDSGTLEYEIEDVDYLQKTVLSKSNLYSIVSRKFLTKFFVSVLLSHCLKTLHLHFLNYYFVSKCDKAARLPPQIRRTNTTPHRNS